MTRKSVFALAAILALGSLSFAADASAKGGGHGGGGGGHGGGGHGGGGGHVGGHVNGGQAVAAPHVGVGPGPGVRVAPEHRASVFVTGGHRRHFWHGRWWYYGVGPCWRWSDVYGEYVWVCD
jgi:hypothetical protein